MIPVKEAVKIANNYINDVFDSDKISKIQLEEIELTDDEQYWFITLSYKYADLAGIILSDTKKNYRIFKIDSETGDVKFMKIREAECQ